jgi:hypothetical protein
MRRYFNRSLAERLCDKAHGSGLDAEPSFNETRRSVRIAWAFHLMDDQGYYDGWWRFVVRIPVADPLTFTIAGRAGNPRRASAYNIRSDLSDRLYDAMCGTLEEAGIESWPIWDKLYPGDPGFNPESPSAKLHGWRYGKARYIYSGELAEA